MVHPVGLLGARLWCSLRLFLSHYSHWWYFSEFLKAYLVLSLFILRLSYPPSMLLGADVWVLVWWAFQFFNFCTDVLVSRFLCPSQEIGIRTTQTCIILLPIFILHLNSYSTSIRALQRNILAKNHFLRFLKCELLVFLWWWCAGLFCTSIITVRPMQQTTLLPLIFW